MIPLSLLLIPYLIFFLGFSFFSFVNLYQLVRFGTAGLTSFFVTFLFLAGTTLVLSATYTYGIEIDWARQIPLLPSFSAPVFE